MRDEQLIELVKRYPILYNTNLAQYRDHTVRNNAWEEIAGEMDTPVEDVKNKWAKLRNCFTNALKRRRKKSGQAATNLVPWKFEKQMEFLLPHLEGRQTVTNLADINDEDSTQHSELQFSEESALSPPPIIRSPTPGSSSSRASAARACTTLNFTPRRTNKNDSDTQILREMVDVMKTTQDMRQKRGVPDMDENDYFFLSMSKQLKKLPKTDQAEIKFQLHKLIHDSEMKMLNNRERILNTPINITSDNIIHNSNKPFIVKPNQSPYTHTRTTEKENVPVNIIPNQTSRDLEKTTLYYNLNTNQIMSNPNVTQYRYYDHSLSAQNDVSKVEAGQLPNENTNLKEYYDSFDHEEKF
ncbi:transcription factor Adf-1-like [Helicoverpa zea]|uniref:transcription factor Adf-1-like n=1 Tax=Helicoverpa zea TaxID=7113 RepID=UPI001F58AE7C|nr:transcription factor Adf-1-like [Helicoverpa zea]XP_047023038.1 transcription factor Adf-1-like [Helicoverpa zea]XP_047028510.1 transcription factor Adf-1-like [Helicoverpa zea]XP_047042202.1 transcription factor Adf-1-like [Helicoverpa zea]